MRAAQRPVVNRAMFSTGYADGLWSRPATPGVCSDADLAKYAEGYRLGVEDRQAGAIELERSS